jgi:beta-lactamase superfamily II metal-dependent hydrolase
MMAVDWLAALPLAVWQQAAPPAWAVLLALAGGVWLLLPRGFPSRWLGLLCFLPLLSVEPPRPLAGTAQVTVLDVGQGWRSMSRRRDTTCCSMPGRRSPPMPTAAIASSRPTCGRWACAGSTPW